jgi:hypothetical protein
MSIYLWSSKPSKIYVWSNEVSAVYVGNTKVRPSEITQTYTISNIPTNDSNVYVNVAKSWYTIQSVTFNFTANYASQQDAFFHISSNNSNTNRYWLVFRWHTSTERPYTWAWLYVRWRLNWAVDRYFIWWITSWFSTSSNVISYTINRNGNCSITCNWTTTNYTAWTDELNIIQKIMNLSNMNVYSSQSWSIISWNSVSVIVTYS